MACPAATEILWQIGEFCECEIDEVCKVKYPHGENPNCFLLKMQNGQTFSVIVVVSK